MIFLVLTAFIILVVVFLKIQYRRENLFRKKVNQVYSRQHSLDRSIRLEEYKEKAERTLVLDTKPLSLDDTGISYPDEPQSTVDQEAGKATRSSDLIADLRLNLQKVKIGTDIEIKIKHLELCSACQGRGCDYCSNQGTRKELVKLKITIPSGAESGTNLRVRGVGDNGGDLYLLLVDTSELIQEGS
jgi:hypothetical protein